MKGKKGKMTHILDKKEFYKLMLRDRFPLAKIDFSAGGRIGLIEFFRTPLGTVARAILGGGGTIQEIKMYDKNRGKFCIQNVFCDENLIEISSGIFVGVSTKLCIEEIVGREFLIKLENMTIITRAETTLIPRRNVDKIPSLVYN